MKRITKKYLVILLVTTLVFVNSSLISVEGKDLENCATVISDLTWDYYTDPVNSSNTAFEFLIEYQFFNPNPKDVVLTFPNQTQFIANMTFEFEYVNLTAYEEPWTAIPAAANVTYEQGVVTYNTNFTLIIEASGLVVLPDGNYSLWVYDDRVANTNPVVIYYETLLVIDAGVPTINYGTVFYTWPFGSIYSAIFISALLVTAIAVKIRKRK